MTHAKQKLTTVDQILLASAIQSGMFFFKE